MLIFQLPRYSAYSSCTTHSPVLVFPVPSYSAHYSRTTTSPVLSFQLPSYSAYYSCTTKSPVLIFPLPSYSAYYSRTTTSPVLSFQLPSSSALKLHYKVASSQLPAPQLAPLESHSRLRFAHSTRTISAEGRAVISQIALLPAFRALDTHDLRRGLPGNFTNRALACISRTRRARSPQRVPRVRPIEKIQ